MDEQEFLRDPNAEEARGALLTLLKGNLEGIKIEPSLKDVLTSKEDINYLKTAPIRTITFPNNKEARGTLIGPGLAT